MFDRIMDWLSRDKKQSVEARRLSSLSRKEAFTSEGKRRVKREIRNGSRYLLRSGRFITRYEARCLEIAGTDILKALARRSDRQKYSTMKAVRVARGVTA